MAYDSLDFIHTFGYPNKIPKLKELPIFIGQDAITSTHHWDEVSHYVLTRYLEHLDMKFKCFASSLRYDAREWWDSLPASGISNLEDLKKLFFYKWLENKYIVLLNNPLMTIKRNENDTTDEFDHMFDMLIKECLADYKPPNTIILSYYLNVFPWNFIFHLGLDKPQYLTTIMKKVKALDEFRRAASIPDTSGHS